MMGAYCIFLACLITGTSSFADETTSLLALVRERNRSIEAIVRSPTGGETQAERDQIKTIVGGLFDFEAFARISLGRYWNDRSADEQAEFVGLCRRLVERNYADPALYKKAEKVEYLGEEVDGEEGIVQTIVHYKTEESAIDYLLRNRDGTWYVFDMVIDDLSIAKNNRSQFRKEIRKTSYEGLVKKLQDKLAQEETP